MIRVRRYSKIVSLLLLLSAQPASADLLFTNFDGDPFGGNLWTGGGPCSFASCYAIGGNFKTDELWHVTGFTFYLVSQLTEQQVGSGVRFAVFTAAGTQVVSPTNAAPTVTDTGMVFSETYKIYKVEITSLAIELDPGEYRFRTTNTSDWGQGVAAAYGAASAQSISPGLIQYSGSSSVEALLSTVEYQREENWAFQVIGTSDAVYDDGFEDTGLAQ